MAVQDPLASARSPLALSCFLGLTWAVGHLQTRLRGGRGALELPPNRPLLPSPALVLRAPRSTDGPEIQHLSAGLPCPALGPKRWGSHLGRNLSQIASSPVFRLPQL